MNCERVNGRRGVKSCWNLLNTCQSWRARCVSNVLHLLKL
jgi:hypothetical protein